jgi:nucleotide-binding universal stress UspA family protein
MSAEEVKTIKTIVLPLDGSSLSDRAAGHARALAVSLKAPVRVIHVFSDIKTLYQCTGGPLEWTDDARPRGVLRPPALVRDVVGWMSEAVEDVQVIGRYGDPAEEILHESTLHDQPLIVMASLGATGLRRALMGSVATSVSRQSRCPVMVIASRTQQPDPEDATFRRIVVLFDGSIEAGSSLHIAAEIAASTRAALDLLHVVSSSAGGPEDWLDDAEDHEGGLADLGLPGHLARQVRSAVGTLEALGAPAKPVVKTGTPEKVINDYVASEDVSLVIAATRQLPALERLTYGSLTDRLIGSLPAPLLLVPAGERV